MSRHSGRGRHRENKNKRTACGQCAANQQQESNYIIADTTFFCRKFPAAVSGINPQEQQFYALAAAAEDNLMPYQWIYYNL